MSAPRPRPPGRRRLPPAAARSGPGRRPGGGAEAPGTAARSRRSPATCRCAPRWLATLSESSGEYRQAPPGAARTGATTAPARRRGRHFPAGRAGNGPAAPSRAAGRARLGTRRYPIGQAAVRPPGRKGRHCGWSADAGPAATVAAALNLVELPEWLPPAGWFPRRGYSSAIACWHAGAIGSDRLGAPERGEIGRPRPQVKTASRSRRVAADEPGTRRACREFAARGAHNRRGRPRPPPAYHGAIQFLPAGVAGHGERTRRPPRLTRRTRSRAARSARGSPSTATRSATAPGATLPRPRRRRCAAAAPVAAATVRIWPAASSRGEAAAGPAAPRRSTANRSAGQPRSRTAVTPPASTSAGWWKSRWTWASTKPGRTVRPSPESSGTPAGGSTSSRPPTASMRPARTSTVRPWATPPPEPSSTRTPTRANDAGGAGVDGCPKEPDTAGAYQPEPTTNRGGAQGVRRHARSASQPSPKPSLPCRLRGSCTIPRRGGSGTRLGGGVLAAEGEQRFEPIVLYGLPDGGTPLPLGPRVTLYVCGITPYDSAHL